MPMNQNQNDIDMIVSFLSAGITSYFIKKGTESRVDNVQNHFLFSWTKYFVGNINPKLISYPVTLVSSYILSKYTSKNESSAMIGSIVGIAIEELEQIK